MNDKQIDPWQDWNLIQHDESGPTGYPTDLSKDIVVLVQTIERTYIESLLQKEGGAPAICLNMFKLYLSKDLSFIMNQARAPIHKIFPRHMIAWQYWDEEKSYLIPPANSVFPREGNQE